MSAGHTVLVVDDEVSIRSLLRDFLGIMKYDVTVAADAEGARAAAQRAQHDLLICDMRLQASDGAELAQELRAQNPAMGVLLVSGQDLSCDTQVPSDFEFMLKPFSLVDLDERLRMMLQGCVAK